MTWAKRNVLRKHPTGPIAAITDYRLLLGSKLRAAWDVRWGGEFAAGVWVAHTDVVSGIRVAAPSVANRPQCVADGTNFRGRRVIRIASSPQKMMYTTTAPNLVPPGSYPEVFAITRVVTDTIGMIAGCTDGPGNTNAGAVIGKASAGLITGFLGGSLVNGAFSDTASVHHLGAYMDTGRRAVIDGALYSSSFGGTVAVVNKTTTAFVGGVEGNDIGDAFVAQWGIVDPPMTDAERTRFYAIAREDWGF